MMNKAAAEKVLTDHGYTSPALVPSQSYIGGWSGTHAEWRQEERDGG
jgi:hypothetical protein